MVFNLDVTDKKILLELDTDATIPLSSVAKKIRISREVVAYRVKKLEENRIILDYITLSHFAKTNLIHFKIYIKYGKITSEIRKEIIDYLMKFPTVGWLASAEGIFDLMISVRFSDIYSFENFKDAFFQKYDAHFHEVRMAILTEAETKPRYYILPEKIKNYKTILHCDQADPVVMDDIDKNLLTAISTKARESYHDLARTMNIPEQVLRYRRKKLEKIGVIAGYKIVINYSKLNYLFFKCFIKFRNINDARYSTLREYVRIHPNIIYWIKTIGSWDAELEIETPSPQNFYKIVNEIREQFADIIETFESSLVSQEHKIAHA